MYKLKVDQFDPHEHMSERAYINLTLPYYNSTLYICLTPANSNEVFHQGDRYYYFFETFLLFDYYSFL